ncbi:MAG: OadG family protein [Syntrophales bacterium]|nr:OadG family protein [Syntrophales bacterium]
MNDIDMVFALTIAMGGLGVVFIILIILAFCIVLTKALSDRIYRSEKTTTQ